MFPTESGLLSVFGIVTGVLIQADSRIFHILQRGDWLFSSWGQDVLLMFSFFLSYLVWRIASLLFLSSAADSHLRHLDEKLVNF